MNDEIPAASAFSRFLRRLARVPKHEIDEQEKRESYNKDRRKTRKPAAKHRQIVPPIEPR